MQTLAQFLISIAGTLATRVLFALGFTIMTYTVLTTAADMVKSVVMASYQSLPAQILQLFNMAGFGDAIGAVLAALASRAALDAGKRLRLK
jgi:hypothetical protein